MNSSFLNFSKTNKIIINVLSDSLIIIFSFFISSKLFEYFLGIYTLNNNIIFIILLINFYLFFFFKNLFFSKKADIYL